ncbi:MAG: hypothetical protein WBA25_10595 [Jannaschia sp.]
MKFPSLATLTLSLLASWGGPVGALTIVVDFDGTKDLFGEGLTPFDPAPFGFETKAPTDLPARILDVARDHYLDFPDGAEDPLSPLPVGMELDIDLKLGRAETAPANGDTEYYAMTVGGGGNGAYGMAYDGSIRPGTMLRDGDIFGTTFSSALAPIAAGATSDAERTRLVAGTIAHELGHALFLFHPDGPRANPGGSPFDLMATGAPPTFMPNSERFRDREFSYGDFGELIDAVGLREVQIAPVPLPAPLAMLGGALLVLVGVRRRQRGLS